MTSQTNEALALWTVAAGVAAIRAETLPPAGAAPPVED